MKCPKCGSEDITWNRSGNGYYDEWWTCNKCECDIAVDTRVYDNNGQQRLDNILIKMKESKTLYSLPLKNKYNNFHGVPNGTLYYVKKHKWFEIHTLSGVFPLRNISVKTVESLINDIEKEGDFQ